MSGQVFPFVEGPTLPDDPSQAVLALSPEIQEAIAKCQVTDNNKQLSLQSLAMEAKERLITLLVKGAMQTVGFQPELYKECVESTVKKALATKLLDTQTLSKWPGSRYMTISLQKTRKRTKLEGKHYCLTAPVILCVYILLHFRKVTNKPNIMSRMINEQYMLPKLSTAIEHHTQESQAGPIVTAQPVEPVSVSPPQPVSDTAKPIDQTVARSQPVTGAGPGAPDLESDGSTPIPKNTIMARTEATDKHEALLDTIMELCATKRQLNEENANTARMVKAHKANARLSQGIAARLGRNSTVRQDYEALVHHLGPAFEVSAGETGDLVDFFHRAKNCDVASSTTDCLAQLVVAVRRLRRKPTDKLLRLIEGKIRTLTDAVGSAEYSLRFERHVQVNNLDLLRQVDDEMAAATSPTLPSPALKRSRASEDYDTGHYGRKRHRN
ncbi:hypothetical protein HRG_011108 [Hirsutella rhossiliensis]|uniref:Uncharacterized protein n=1 Tax=Hirsutella rhossiliensis TaxID=111463 RepID=A0A9P8MMS7_9HYPO|nr:uncharacterized protein HRG_11108 [Hirsutella rhossiliensis]KAH0958015.1 hypothetical protein HRG_11108 [Hirsutella rhossiliensis]